MAAHGNAAIACQIGDGDRCIGAGGPVFGCRYVVGGVIHRRRTILVEQQRHGGLSVADKVSAAEVPEVISTLLVSVSVWSPQPRR